MANDKLLRDALRALHALAHPQNFLASHNATTIARRDKAAGGAHRVLRAARSVGFIFDEYDVTDMTTGVTHKRGKRE